MIEPTYTLAVSTDATHSTITCGQSRGGGVRTSIRERRSRFLGRVAVAHVQGSPKGGGALGSLEVLTTRLWSVPPSNGGKVMRRTARLSICILVFAVSSAAPAQAQDLGGLLGGVLGAPTRSSKVKNACLDRQVAVNYAAYMMGYNVFDTGGGERVSIEKNDALAQEIISRATISEWSFKGSNGGTSYGQCLMHFTMSLALTDAAHFNNTTVWDGDVSVAMTPGRA